MTTKRDLEVDASVTRMHPILASVWNSNGRDEHAQDYQMIAFLFRDLLNFCEAKGLDFDKMVEAAREAVK
jgi:hypothetical protein